MILLNGTKHELQNEMTVQEFLKVEKFTYPRITVVVNEKIIPAEEYSSTMITNGDNVQVIHLMAGG